MKHILKSLIIIGSFIALCFNAASAQFNIQTTIGSYNSSNCAVGDTIILPVTVNMASGISLSAISLTIDFDTTKLRCIPGNLGGNNFAVNVNTLISNGLLSNVTYFQNLVPNIPYTGARRKQIRIAWSDLTPRSFSGLMFNLRFVALSIGSSIVKWDLVNPELCSYANFFGEVIGNVSFVDGNVACGAPSPPPCNSPVINVTASGPTTFCQGDSVVLRVDTSSNYTYQWRKDGVNIVGATNDNYHASTSGIYSVVVQNVLNCITISNTTLISVNQGNSLALTSAVGTNSQIVTINSPISNITYASSGATGATISGLPNGVNGIWASNVLTISGNPRDTGIFNYLITLVGGCPGGRDTITGRIVVNTSIGIADSIRTNVGTFSLSTCSVGDTIILPVTVTMSSTTRIGSLALALDFDTTRLRCIPTISGGGNFATNLNPLIANNFISNLSVYHNLLSNPPYTGSSRRQIRVNWNSLSPVTINGLLFNLRFVVVTTGSSVINWDTITQGNCFYRDSAGVIFAGSRFISGNITCSTPCVPPPSYINAGDTNYLCSGDSVTLNANTGTGFAYQWWKNDTLIVGANSSSLTIRSSGIFKVQIFRNGCFSFSQNIAVLQNLLNVAVSPSGTVVLCPNSNISLNATQLVGAIYQWRKNNFAIPGATSTFYSAGTTGIYSVVVFRNGCSAVSPNVVLQAAPNQSELLNYPDTLSLCSSDSFVLNAQGVTGTTYQWYRNSLPISGATTSQLLVRDTGSYSVVGTVSGCPFPSSSVFFKRTIIGPILLTSASGAENQVVCRNSPIVPIVYSTNGITSATFVGLPSGLTGSFINGQARIQGSSSVNGIFSYKILYQSICSLNVETYESNGFINVNNCGSDSSIILTTGTYYNGNCNIGDTISIPVSISMPLGLSVGSMSFALNYDSTKVQCLGATINNPNLLSNFSNNCSFHIGLGSSGLGFGTQWRGQWSSSVSRNFQGQILTLRFKVRGSGFSNLAWDIASPGLIYFQDSSGVVSYNFHTINGLYKCGTACNLPSPIIRNSGDSVFCDITGTTLVASHLSGVSYQWIRNGIAIPGATTSVYWTNQSGNYGLGLTLGNCVSFSNSLNTVSVPSNTIQLNSVGTNSFCLGGGVDLIVSGGTLSSSYVWYRNDNVIPNVQGNVFRATQGGIYKVLVNNAGCVIYSNVLSVNQNQNYSLTSNVTLCQGATFTFCNQILTLPGTYSCNLSSINGCDSTVTLNLDYKRGSNTTLTPIICLGDTFNVNAYQFYNSGSYLINLSGAAVNGCDSTVEVALNVIAPIYNFLTVNICQGDTFYLGINPLLSSGIYTDTLTASSGCDSIVRVTLGISPKKYSSFNSSICQGETVTFGSQLLSSAGVYSRTIPSSNGCDSLITLTLTVRPHSTAAISATICAGQSYVFGTQSLTIAGTYNRTIPSANGCDSVITLDLTVRPNSTAAISATICEGQSYVFGTQSLTASGTYNRTIPSANGCDSVITLTLTIGANTSSTISASICPGQSYNFGTQVLTSAGSYTRTVPSINGCDSVITLALTVGQNSTAAISASICEGQSYAFGTQTLTAAGTYNRTVPSANGCDSVITLALMVRPNSTAAISDSICAGQSYAFGTQSLTAAGTYNRTILSANGCDSVITLALTVRQNSTAAISASICAGQSYAFGTQSLSAAGIYNSTVPSANGCDSVITLDLIVNPIPTVNVSAGGPTTFCQGGSVILSASPVTGGTYQWTNGGIDIPGATQLSYIPTITGNFAVRFTNANGCVGNSANTLVTVNPLPVAPINASGSTTFCAGGFVTLCTDSILGAIYQWRRNGQDVMGAVNSCFRADTTGTYSVLVSLNQCSTLSSSILVTQTQSPVITITPNGPTTFCQGSTVQLCANLSGTNLVYQWFRNGQVISGATTSCISASETGAYSVSVTINNCSFLSSALLVFVNQPSLAIISPTGPLSFCFGDSVVLNANMGSGLNYQWQQNGVDLPGSTNMSFVARTTGIFSVRITNILGCASQSNGVIVSVNSLPPITILPSGNLSFCSGDSIVLTSSVTTYIQYQWLRNGIDIPGATLAQYEARLGGIYTLKVTNNNGCTNVSNTLSVNILQPSLVTLIDSICQGSIYQFCGLPITQPGTYSCTLSNINGCDSIISLTLLSIIKPQPPLITPSINRDTLYALPQGPTRWFRNGLPVFGGANGVLPVSLAGTYYAVRDSIVGTITCTSDSSNRVYKSGVFVSNENIFNVFVYPNPTNGILNLKSDYFFNSKDFEFKLVTSTGILIQSGYSLGRTDFGYELNLLDLPNSVYFVHINDEKSKAIIKVVLKR